MQMNKAGKGGGGGEDRRWTEGQGIDETQGIDLNTGRGER